MAKPRTKTYKEWRSGLREVVKSPYYPTAKDRALSNPKPKVK